MKIKRLCTSCFKILLVLSLVLTGTGRRAVSEAAEDNRALTKQYQEYQRRFDGVEKKEDISGAGFQIIEDQVFTLSTEAFGDVSLIPALDKRYHRLVLFLSDVDGRVVYKTDQLETNYQKRGELSQPGKGIAAVSFQDLNGDGLTDIVLITSCHRENAGTASYAGQVYKVGDVLFQNEQGFYRDWRLSDKINRYGMNKSIRFIVSFVNEGYSTEFLYTATTMDELKSHGFRVITEQSYWREFEKLGRLLVVPGTYRMAEYTEFMVYLVNEQGYIVWSFQPMGDYENLYALKGINCSDIDGDGLKDIIVLASYSYEGDGGVSVVESDYSVYYQRTGGFYEETPTQSADGDGTGTSLKSRYPCGDDDTIEALIKKARAYWGWKAEK